MGAGEVGSRSEMGEVWVVFLEWIAHIIGGGGVGGIGGKEVPVAEEEAVRGGDDGF